LVSTEPGRDVPGRGRGQRLRTKRKAAERPVPRWRSFSLRAIVNGIAVEAGCSISGSISARKFWLACSPRPPRKNRVNVLATEVKDVLFPAELKRAFADVLKAKRRATPRWETRSRRSAVPAHLRTRPACWKAIPALMNLRLIAVPHRLRKTPANTLVLGVPGFVPLKNGNQTRLLKHRRKGEARRAGAKAPVRSSPGKEIINSTTQT